MEEGSRDEVDGLDALLAPLADSVAPDRDAAVRPDLLAVMSGGVAAHGAVRRAVFGGAAALFGSLAGKVAIGGVVVATATGIGHFSGAVDVPGLPEVDGETTTVISDDPPTAAGEGDSGGGEGGSEEAPGHTGETPGQSGETPASGAPPPGQVGATPGQSGAAPGQDPGGPGNSEHAPGHDPDGPGNSEHAPGHDPDGPGNSESVQGGRGGEKPEKPKPEKPKPGDGEDGEGGPVGEG